MGELADAVRLAIRYGPGVAEIVSATLIRAVDPTLGAPVPTGADGLWLVVRDPHGQEVFRHILPDPSTGGEVFDGERAVAPATPTEQRLIVLEVPWPGAGSTVAILGGGATARREERPPAALPLVPVRAIVPEGPSFPLVVHDQWGAANARALTLLFLPDGFLTTEMDAFHSAVQNSVALFGQTSPFSNMTQALRIAHVDIPSNQSGIVGTKARDTAFGSRFEEAIDRVILTDQDRALAALNRYVPGGSGVAMIVANTTQYGGSGGAAMVFSCDSRAPEIAIHELGHSAFGLADEYATAGQSATDEPVEPNVSRFGDRPRLKWASLVPAAVPLPTLSASDPPPAVPPAGVGAFEGAKYHPTGRYRPAYDCKMRTLGQPFCAVCQGSIRSVLSRHLP